MYYYAIAFVCEYLCIPYFNSMTKLFAVAQLAPMINLLQAIVFWLLWFGGVFTIRFVGSPLFLLILSGQANYFFIPFKGNQTKNETKNKKQTRIKFLKKLKKKKERKWPCINDSKIKAESATTDRQYWYHKHY